jgi:hypothetical protein
MIFQYLRVLCFLLAFRAGLWAEDGPKNGVVLIIRHAEKPESGQGLSPRGEERAKAYPRYFHHLKVDGKKVRLDAIFAASDSKSSHRPRLTITPLARAAGVPVNAEIDDGDTGQLARALRQQEAGRTTLVCWRHGKIPDLLAALGARPEKLLPDGAWPDDHFDWVIVLRYDGDGKLEKKEAKRIEEHLLPGD